MSLSRVLHVLAELRVRPSEIWSGHIDKIAQASDYPTIAAVESRVRRRIALLFRETCSRLHRRKCRNAVPHLEGTQDVFGKVTLREESASRRDIALNFTAEVSVYGTFVCAVESGQKVCAECVQRITVSARKDEIVNVCLNEERMAVDGSAPHASLKTDESASLRFKIGAHGRMPGTGNTWHAV